MLTTTPQGFLTWQQSILRLDALPIVKREIFTDAPGVRVNAVCTAASPANNYTLDDVLRIY